MIKTLFPRLFQVPYPLPELPALDMKLKRLSILSTRTLDGNPVNNKTFRKTWESWLVLYYPDKALQIALSQGHTTTTQYEHYLNTSFEEEDRKEMRKWVEGWIQK
jgi:integrase